MLSLIRNLFRLLTPAQRRRFYRLQLMVVVMALAEIAGVAAIGPFMALISNLSLLEGEGRLASLFRLSGFTNPHDFVFFTGCLVLLLIVVSSLFSIFTLSRLVRFGQQVGVELSDRLFSSYLHESWLFHASGSSSTLRSRIASDAYRVSTQIIHPLMQLNAKAVLIVFISTAIFLFNPLVALGGLLLFAGVYLLLYRLARYRLSHSGATVTQVNMERQKLMSESFGGIKDTLLLGRQRSFIQRFHGLGERLARAETSKQLLTLAPRYLVEMVAYGSVIFLVLFLVRSGAGNLQTLLPTLAIYALAGFKLLPAFQQSYAQLTTIRAAMASFEAVRPTLERCQPTPCPADSNEKREFLRVRERIALQSVTFSYPNKPEPALRQLSIEIPANTTVGIVGSTGSGKSTLIDLLLGLVQPDSGQILIDGVPLQPQQLRAWQNTLGFVPQAIFLSDASIMENIAFGLAPESIDRKRVEQVAKMAHLDELVSQLPQGYETRVGERGVQLSGGQRQRIGIARALYQDADVLILDEATSALDGITERIVMEAIQDFSGQKTIIMIAHRFTTVQKCDMIFLMENGTVADQGTYPELLARNPTFQKMASQT